MFYLVQILVPIFICVVLPVLAIWLLCRSNMNSDNKRAEVLIEAIKANNNINTDTIAKAFSKPSRTPYETLMRRLLKGCFLTFAGLAILILDIVFWKKELLYNDDAVIWLFIAVIALGLGISFLIVYFISRKTVMKEKTEKK